MRKANSGTQHTITSVRKDRNGEVLKVTVRLPMKFGWFERVRLNVVSNASFDLNSVQYDIPHARNDDDTGYAIFETEIYLTTSALYYYYFSYDCNGQHFRMKKKDVTGNSSITKQECFRISINFSAPDWAKGATMYHILVDKFYRSPSYQITPIPGRTMNNWNDKPVLGPNANNDWNVDFYGGNLLGIVEKLDYIQSLGVTLIYLSPILRGQSNHLYDTVDYEQIDPYLGTTEDLKLLCSEVHKRGMYLVIDGVYNHTGNRSRYFDQFEEYGNGAYNHKDSPYRPFYKRIWHNSQSCFSYWWDVITLPECDTTNLEWQDYITAPGGVIDQLFECGIDGIRLDVADELDDSMIYRIMEAIIRNKPDGFLFGEVWDEHPMRPSRGYISSGIGMHSLMNYMLPDALIRFFKYRDTGKLQDMLNRILIDYPVDTILTMMNPTSTHDMSRLIEIFACNVFDLYGKWAWDMKYANDSDFVKNHVLSSDEYEYGKMVLMSYVVALAFFPGIFSIFYGDEVGLPGLHNLANRVAFPWGSEDRELQEYFINLIKVRNSNKFLKYAECEVREISEKHFSFERILGDERILVIVSRSHHVSEISVPEGYEIIFRNNICCTESVLPPYGAIVLKAKVASTAGDFSFFIFVFLSIHNILLDTPNNLLYRLYLHSYF